MVHGTVFPVLRYMSVSSLQCMQATLAEMEMQSLHPSLHTALRSCQIAAILVQHYLQHDPRFTTTLVDKDGKTSLIHAVQSRFYPAVTAILHPLAQHFVSADSDQQKVLPINWQCGRGRTVMHYWADNLKCWAAGPDK